MNSWKLLSLSLLALASASMAGTSIGCGLSPVTTATIKGVELQANGLAWFSINETPGTTVASHIWRWDSQTTVGKNMLSAILTAKAGNIPVCFSEGALLVSGTTNEYAFDGLWINRL
jgi:hypothetical protein